MEHTELYDILGVSKSSTDADIKKNYRKLAKEFHPDKNPAAGDKFKEISFAYEVLSDPDKRKTYDRFGLKGIQEGSDGFADASDLFSQWFPFGHGHGAGAGGASGSARSKAAHVMVYPEVTLEEIYNGNVLKTVEFSRTEFCEQCLGEGGPKEAIEKCSNCRGTGRTAAYNFAGLSGFESVCQGCSGRGTTVKQELRCSSCAGSGLRSVTLTREITVERGAPNMLKISFPAEGNQPLMGQRGDLIVTLIQQEHPLFIRRKNDLFLRDVRVNLAEALCGFVKVFKHLDGRDICIRNEPGEVIRNGDMKVILGEGMPLRNNPFSKGDLFVEFRVEFPANGFATLEQLQTLETMLPPREPFLSPDEAEEVQLVDAQPFGEDQGAAGAHGEEDDDDYDGGVQFDGVQCHTA